MAEIHILDPGTGDRTPVVIPGIHPAGGEGVGVVGQITAITSDGDKIWFTHSSLISPPHTYSVGLADNGIPHLEHGPSAEELDRMNLPDVQASLHKVASADGTPVYGQLYSTTPLDEPAPLVQIVYPNFNVGNNYEFQPDLSGVLERGVRILFVDARGGGAEGKLHHVAGIRVGRQRSVDDVIAFGHYAVDAGLTTHDRMALAGQSAAPLVLLNAIKQDPTCWAVGEMARGQTNLVDRRGLHWAEREYVDWTFPDSAQAAIRDSIGLNEAPDQPLPLILFTGDREDRRVPTGGIEQAFMALTVASRDNPMMLYLQDVGHFAHQPELVIRRGFLLRALGAWSSDSGGQ
jgi:prolyl oligopeptidase PreP (S9A serine peptidase family)